MTEDLVNVGKLCLWSIWSGEYDKFVIFENFLVTTPVVQVCKVVHPDDELDFSFRIGSLEGTEGKDRVGNLSAVLDFVIGPAEIWIINESFFEHVETMCWIGELLADLVRWLGSWHEEDFVCEVAFDGFIGQGKVA